ncbi:MAG: SCP2 sterol-binding domain-containing protein [Pseudonocardiales bacterium]|nr:SCP2 sterol-binding domain-containing protein [Pseudonocardiales bacterium]
MSRCQDRKWTTREAAAHLAFGAVDYAEHARGVQQCYQVDPTDTVGSHRRSLAAMVQRGSHQLSADLQLYVCAFLDATEGRAAADLMCWHGGSLRCADMTCLLIGEQLLHGYDLAQAVGAEWLIETEPARLVVQALLPILPALVDDKAAKGVDATYELAVHGGPRVTARFRDATASIGPPDSGIAGCRLSGDPVAWLLALYGRVGWEELLRTGRVTVTGGDATLGAGFKRLLRNP